ncbi:MAG: hypothetical protein WA240_14800 [Nitrospirota bacterium]
MKICARKPMNFCWDFAWELITAYLGKAFQVSSSVIEKRLDKDGIKEKYKK